MKTLSIEEHADKEPKANTITYVKSVMLEVKEADNMMAVYLNVDNDHGPNSSIAYHHHMNGFGARVVLNDSINITPLLGQIPEDFDKYIKAENRNDILTLVCSNFESFGKFDFILRIDGDEDKSFAFCGTIEPHHTHQFNFWMVKQ